MVSNCWSPSDSSVPQTASYARRGFHSWDFLTNSQLSSESGSRHTHRTVPPESRIWVFDPIPAPTSRMSPLRKGRIWRDQYAFQFNTAANRSNSEPTYLNSLMRIDIHDLYHKE